jgi:D-alanyl-lipoteichoic acid acyltransferase DltB (MBOAT superfamily)
MIDGMETVENMTKCMTNHYSGIGFWRNWHSSFNKWLIRYLYIPLGGANQRAWNTFVIFTFVAGWHDIELKLLAWGWLIALFILPEILCVKIFCTNEMRDRFGDLYIHLCAFGGLLNILMMMTANLVGFALGTDGMWELLGNLLQPSGFTDLVFCCSSLFSFVHVQFAHEGEKRNHKRMKSS